MRNAASIFRIAMMSVMLLLVGTAPVFSQEILATFGLGAQFSDYSFEEYFTIPAGVTAGVNVLSIGRFGFAISAGADIIWEFPRREEWGDDGWYSYTDVDINPMLGLGYVYYRLFYIGGILNVLYKPNFHSYHDDNDRLVHGDICITPTFVAGFDFGRFVLGGQLSYISGIFSRANGFRFVLGIGVNMGRRW